MRTAPTDHSGGLDLKFLDWMLPIVDHHARHQIVCGGRRIHKTDLLLKWTILKTLQSPFRGEGWYIAPYRTQAKLVAWRRILDILLHQKVRIIEGRTNETDLLIPLIDGKAIRLVGADKFDNLRGGGPVCAGIDETPLCDPRCWEEVVRPALSDKAAPVMCASTPRGQEYFYRMWRNGAEGKEGWKNWTITSEEAGTIPPSELVDLRKSLPWDVYRQEFLAQFLEYIGAVVPQFVHRPWPEGNILPEEKWAAFLSGAVVFGSMDWGVRNATVHHWWAADTHGRLVGFDEMVVSGKTVEEVAKEIKGRPHLPRVTVLDKSAWRRESNLGTIAGTFMQAGLPVVESDSRIADSVSLLRSMCRPKGEEMPKFMILEGRCPVLLEQLRLLQYNEKAKEDEGKFDRAHDAFDSARYAVMFGGRAEEAEKRMSMAELLAFRPVARIDSEDNDRGGFSPMIGMPD